MSIFVSYSSLDKLWARKLVHDLRENELSVWFDEDSIFPGDSIPNAIAEGLETSKTVLVILSKNAIKSNWVTEELGGALFRAINEPSRNVIPILLEPCDPPLMIAHRKPYDLSDYSKQIPQLLKLLHEIEENSEEPLLNIPGYHSFKLIGEGGFGTVYRCFSETKEQYCAIKIAKSKVLPLSLEKDIQELLADSSHIVPIIDTGNWRGKPFIVMPYVGHSLKWHLRQGQIKPHQIHSILEIAIGILEGLQSAHLKNVIHCDVKPSNILIDELGRPLLCDFGLSYEEQTLHFKYSTMIRGTICYMSPEQQLGLELDSRTDIYSFGTVLYEMLTGVKPIGRFQDASLINHLIPNSIETIVNKCLQVDASRRYSTVNQIILELENAKRDLTIARRLRKRQDTRKLIIISKAIQEVADQLARFSELDIDCLLTGPTGVGKTMFARWSHNHSPRKGREFVEVNVTAITETLAISELFGHEKGAFTGATGTRIGFIERANGGTVFLDEIGDMPMSVQQILLKVLETGEFIRVGSSRPIRVDVRWIFATNKDLQALVQSGKFRNDLLARISQTIHIPALKDRPEDILPLIESFSSALGFRIVMTPTAERIITVYDWPLNVRQVDNFLTYLATLPNDKEGVIAVDERIFRDFCLQYNGLNIQSNTMQYTIQLDTDMRVQIEMFKLFLIKTAVNKFGRKTAAEILNIDRNTIYRILSKNGYLNRDSEWIENLETRKL